jgi:hypothetical protein
MKASGKFDRIASSTPFQRSAFKARALARSSQASIEVRPSDDSESGTRLISVIEGSRPH